MGGITSRRKYKAPPSERKTLRLSDAKKQPPPKEEESYQSALRLSLYDGITTSDVTEIVKNVVARAKTGDAASLKIVFDYLLSGKRSPAQAIVTTQTVTVEQAAREARQQRIIAGTVSEHDDDDDETLPGRMIDEPDEPEDLDIDRSRRPDR